MAGTRTSRLLSTHAEEPAFDAGERPLWLVQDGLEVADQTAFAISLLHPSRDAVGVVLVGGSILDREGVLREGRAYLGDAGDSGNGLQAVEGTEVRLRSEVPAQEAQPGDSRVGELGDLPRTSNWNTDSARDRSSQRRRQRFSPPRIAPLPAMPSRTQSTLVDGSPAGQWPRKSSRNPSQSPKGTRRSRPRTLLRASLCR